MSRLAFWVFIGILVYGVTHIDEFNDKVDKILEKTEIILKSSRQVDSNGHKCDGCGTTRCIKFRKNRDEAVRIVDEQMMYLPARLVLPGGETVQDRISRIGTDMDTADK